MKASKIYLISISLLLCTVAVAATHSAHGENISSPVLSTQGFIFSSNLTLGSHGDDVTVLQKILIAGGYLNVPTTTDYFGPLTKKALETWQAATGITPASGFFGPLSRGKMNATTGQASGNITSTQNAVSTTTATTVTTTTIATTNTAMANEYGSPVRLTIPKLNIDAGFQDNGLKSDGTMEVPSNIYDVGWFTGSVHPGEPGVAIITGHVAQIRGGVVTKPGVFSDLNALTVGDKLYIQDDKGASIAFVVREIHNYDPTADATDVFTAQDNGAHLNLITCEGTWNAAKLSYTERLVVFSDLVVNSPNNAAQ
jgi:LPXTG-site transpeptidase (sortase) family protein